MTITPVTIIPAATFVPPANLVEAFDRLLTLFSNTAVWTRGHMYRWPDKAKEEEKKLDCCFCLAGGLFSVITGMAYRHQRTKYNPNGHPHEHPLYAKGISHLASVISKRQFNSIPYITPRQRTSWLESIVTAWNDDVAKGPDEVIAMIHKARKSAAANDAVNSTN